MIVDIDNLDGLPDPVAYKIFSLMKIGDLIEWEFRKKQSWHADVIKLAYVHHFGLNITSLFHYFKNTTFESTSHYLNFCRKSCIHWFLESNILKLNMSDIASQRLLGNFGQDISSLSLLVNDDQVSLNKYFLRNIAGYLKNLRDLKFTFLHFNPIWISISEYLITQTLESLTITFGNASMCYELQPRLLSRFLKALASRRLSKIRKNKVIIRNNSPMDVAGVNHFTSEEKSINDFLNDNSLPADFDATLNVYTLNEDIVYYFEKQNTYLAIEHITCLDFSNLRLGSEGIIVLVNELRNFKNLVALNVFNTYLCDDGICYLIKHIPLLQNLNIGNNSVISSSLESLESSKLIAKYIMRSDSNLQDISLSGNKFSFMGMRIIYESIQKCNRNNLSVDLSNMEIKTSISYLSKTGTNLKNLNISDNAIISRSLTEFLSSLNMDSLETLDISHNFMDKLTLECLGRRIMNGDAHNLKILKISGRSDSIKLNGGDFEILLESLIRNPCKRLEQIDLSNHDIGDQLCDHISQVILKNNRLCKINLSNNRITIDGIKFFSVLDKLRRIIQIDLQKNYIYGNIKYSQSNKWRHYLRFDNQHN